MNVLYHQDHKHTAEESNRFVFCYDVSHVDYKCNIDKHAHDWDNSNDCEPDADRIDFYRQSTLAEVYDLVFLGI